MQEKAITLNGPAKLAAVITLPKINLNDPDAPAVIILNEGILHRIGAGRLHVKVARRLAQYGLLCMRMDHSSIGDSGPRRGTQAFEEAAVTEVQSAMDYLTNVYGSKKFIIYGLCSGSDVAFELGVIDDRIAGLIQLDPHIYTTKRSKLNQFVKHYGPRILQPGVWVRAIKRKLTEITTGKKATKFDVLKEKGRDEWYADPDYIRVKPPKDYVERGLRVITGKKIPMYLCFTDGGYYGVYNYVNQFRDAFSSINFADLLEVQFIPGSTHLFTALNHQEQLFREIDNWLLQHRLLPASGMQEAA